MRSILPLLLCALPACAIHTDLPDGFLELESSASALKATTADDATFFVERFGVPKKGENLGFWVDALQNDLVKNRGYTLLANEPTRTKAGVEGRQMMFEVTTQGTTYRYLVAVFLTEGFFGSEGLLWGPLVYAARFAAPKDVFGAHLESVKTAIGKLSF